MFFAVRGQFMKATVSLIHTPELQLLYRRIRMVPHRRTGIYGIRQPVFYSPCGSSSCLCFRQIVSMDYCTRINLFEEIFNTLKNGYSNENLRYAFSMFHFYLGTLRYIQQFHNATANNDAAGRRKCKRTSDSSYERKRGIAHWLTSPVYSAKSWECRHGNTASRRKGNILFGKNWKRKLCQRNLLFKTGHSFFI